MTVIAEDAFEADRVRQSVSRAGAKTGEVAVLTEADRRPAADIMFAPPHLMLADAGLPLCLCQRGRIGGKAAPSIAVHLHASCAEVALAEPNQGDAAKIAEVLTRIGLPVLFAAADATRFAGVALLEAVNALADDILLAGAVPWEVDEALEAIGFAQGLFLMQDREGLGPIRDDAPLLVRDRMVREGRLGRAVGVGWYRYPGGGGAVIDPLMEDMIVEEARFAGIARSHPDAGQIQKCMMVGIACAGAEMLLTGELAHEEAFQDLAHRLLGAPDVMGYVRRLDPRTRASALSELAARDPSRRDSTSLEAWLIHSA